MDDRGNTTKKTYGKTGSLLAYVLFALMFIVGGTGIALFYNSVHRASGSTALPAATFTPFLSSPLGLGGKCEIIPDAEDFISCKTDYESIADPQVLRCPSGYGNIRVTKVRDGETGKKSSRDMALMRHACLGMDSCKVTLSDLRAVDDGTALDDQPTPFDDEIPIPVEEEEIIEPEEIIENVAGVDSNGHVLMKHHAHHKSHAGQAKVYYECDKIETDPFSFLESIFEDMISEPEVEVTPVEEIGNEEIATEESPIFLSKALGRHKCKTKLKNVAQDWDAGAVCGTSQQEMILSCDPARSGTRIFVLNVTPKIPKTPATAPGAGPDSGVDNVIEDTASSVENEPFLAKHGGHHGHHKNHKNGHKKEGKHLGWQLTDICATQTGDCTTTLGNDLQLSEANPLIDATTPIHVKYLCSYEH